MSRRRALWVGDAIAATGFSKATRAACDGMAEAGWDVHILGINANGDPHDWPFPVYPAARSSYREDAFGCDRIGPLTKELKPDLVVLLNDPWNVPRYVEEVREVDPLVPMAGWIAVDGGNCRGTALNGLEKCIFWTHYGEREAKKGGYLGETAVVPLGVDLATYWSKTKEEAFKQLEMPSDRAEHFIVGAVGRNQGRKRLDLTIAYFADWMQSRKLEDVQLLMHVAPTGDPTGWDLAQLGKFYGLEGHMLTIRPNFYHGVPESSMAWTYCACDVYLSTTQGEGMGLTALEAMACGVPCVLPDWSAYGEWARDAALLVPCTEVVHTPAIGAVGGLIDRRGVLEALDALYADKSLRAEMARRGLALARRPEYRWDAVGRAFAGEMEHFASVYRDEVDVEQLVASAGGAR